MADDEPPQAAADDSDSAAEAEAEAEALAMAEIADDPAYGEELIRQNNRTYAALVGAGLILIQPFVGSARLDAAGLVCVIGFAVAIPLLAGLILLNAQESFRHRTTRSMMVTVAQQAALGAAFIGVAGAFWHIEWIAGVVVIVAAAAAIAVHSVGWTRLERDSAKAARPGQG
ncbi:hypothetical protein HII28_06895 [Planctomonas sp. JC2975]|uniref:hypothetical protein n=1 Tax=Planctomonas sp. JC2975 TaxID=2729626 RepID=UPI001472FF0E|nr:hypothetical protein [Planctomonas sp. JC2975]NNC11603.1 hypothetical protein [Planctomonas sp. JC2975]